MAKKRRQLVLMGAGPGGSPVPLGRLADVRQRLASFNTAGDGSATETGGIERLHGPGMVVELPTSLDPINQAVATLNDEDYAFPILLRICKTLGWRMMDMESGRVFGG